MASLQKWEYLAEPAVGNPIPGNLEPNYEMQLKRENAAANQRLLNQRGAEGWELCAIGAVSFYFKRPK